MAFPSFREMIESRFFESSPMPPMASPHELHRTGR